MSQSMNRGLTETLQCYSQLGAGTAGDEVAPILSADRDLTLPVGFVAHGLPVSQNLELNEAGC